MPTVEIPLEIDGLEEAAEICKSRVCGHRVEGIYCGDKVSEWLSLVLGRPNLKLIRQNSDGGELSFSSQAQYLLINRTSVRWLIDQIPEDSDCDKKTILNRFRGNFIVDGADAFEEIDWRRIVIGKTFFEVKQLVLETGCFDSK